MKDFSLVTRLRGVASASFAPEVQRPFRLWMTGSLAVVMAAMIPLRDLGENDRSNPLRVLRHSRFTVQETVLRIEHAARQQGLSVLARIDGLRPVIVLASSVGGTLVVMNEADSAPDVPLSVVVQAGEGGGADVLFAADAPRSSGHWHEVPQAVVEDLAALAGLVERALS